jgi:hypothetical protein
MLRQHDVPRAVDGTPASPRVQPQRDASGHVALLAATALGFAYSPTGDDETHASRLVTLAGARSESLRRAQAAVLKLDVGCAQARTQAAELLRRATRNVVGPCGAGLPGRRGAVGALTVTTEARP